MDRLRYATDISEANVWAMRFEKREARYARQEAERLDRLERRRKAYALAEAAKVMKLAGMKLPPDPEVVEQIGDAMRRIAQEVADKHGLHVSSLKSRSRLRALAWPRQEAYARMYSETRASLPMIARFFDRDHTSVLYGIREHAKREAANGAA